MCFYMHNYSITHTGMRSLVKSKQNLRLYRPRFNTRTKALPLSKFSCNAVDIKFSVPLKKWHSPAARKFLYDKRTYTSHKYFITWMAHNLICTNLSFGIVHWVHMSAVSLMLRSNQNLRCSELFSSIHRLVITEYFQVYDQKARFWWVWASLDCDLQGRSSPSSHIFLERYGWCK